MSEFIFKDMIHRHHLDDQFYIASAATSTEEIYRGVGNPVYPPARAELAKHGISCEGKRAVQLTKQDYEDYDYLIAMDSMNVRNMRPIVGEDTKHKIYKLLNFSSRPGADIADPWYTGNFRTTYSDVEEGCEGLLAFCLEKESCL